MASANRIPASIPMLTSDRRLTLSGGTSSAPVAFATSARNAFSSLPRCFTPRPVPAGTPAGWIRGIAAPDALLAERVHRDLDGAVVADAEHRDHEQRGDVTVAPVRHRADRRVAQLGEADPAVVVEAQLGQLEVAVRDAGVVQAPELGPGLAQHDVGELVVGEVGQRPAGRHPGDEDRGIRPGHPGRDDRRHPHALPGGEEERVRRVLHLLEPAAERRGARRLVHELVPDASGELGVPLVTTERDARGPSLPPARRTRMTVARAIGSTAGATSTHLEPELREGVTDLPDRRPAARRTEGHVDRGTGHHADEQPAPHVRREPGPR